MLEKQIVDDVFDDPWVVHDSRPTGHGWDVCLGVPYYNVGSRGKATIVTKPLAEYLAAHRLRPKDIELPLSRTTIKRLRKLLGHNWSADNEQWWYGHADELAAMTIDRFAKTHGCSTGAASQWHRQFFGARLRAAGWWRSPETVDILLSDMPRIKKAELLGVAIGTIGRLGWQVKQEIKS